MGDLLDRIRANQARRRAKRERGDEPSSKDEPSRVDYFPIMLFMSRLNAAVPHPDGEGIHIGDEGSAVAVLQAAIEKSRLQEKDTSFNVTSFFDDRTRQELFKLTLGYTLDNEAYEVLKRKELMAYELGLGSEGINVIALQSALRSFKGHENMECTGKFDGATKKAADAVLEKVMSGEADRQLKEIQAKEAKAAALGVKLYQDLPNTSVSAPITVPAVKSGPISR